MKFAGDGSRGHLYHPCSRCAVDGCSGFGHRAQDEFLLEEGLVLLWTQF